MQLETKPCPESEQPQQEWTAKTVLELWQKGGAGCDTRSRMVDIADAHNAALTDREREFVTKSLNTVIELKRQLAAEERRADDATVECVRLLNRLADEREKVKVVMEALERVRSQCQLSGRSVIDDALAKVKEAK